MATLLHIQASPMGGRSFSLRAAQAFLESYRQAHPDDTVRTLDLTKDAIPDFDALAAAGKYKILHRKPHSPEEAQAWKAIESTIEDLTSADKLVISSPMWNFSVPYRLKQYIDVIVQPGYTFSYTPKDGYTGLLTGRPAFLILARGGTYPPGTQAGSRDLQKPYLELILGFVGFTDIDTILVEPTLEGGPDLARQKLDEAIATAREKAKTF